MAEIGDEFMIGGRKLAQLKNDELKQELEKRGLKKSGNKAALIERLSEYLFKELYENQQQQQQPAPQQPVQQPIHQQPVGFHGQGLTQQQPQTLHQQSSFPGQQQYQQFPGQQQFQQFNQQQQQVPFQSPPYQATIQSPTGLPNQQQLLQQIPGQSPGLQQQINHQQQLQHQQNYFQQQSPQQQQTTPFTQAEFHQEQFLQHFPGQGFNTQQLGHQQKTLPVQQDLMQQQDPVVQSRLEGVTEAMPEDDHDESSSSSTIIDEQEPAPAEEAQPVEEEQPTEMPEEKDESSSGSSSSNSSQQPSPAEASGEPSPAAEQDKEEQSSSSSSSSAGEEELSPNKPERSALNQEEPVQENRALASPIEEVESQQLCDKKESKYEEEEAKCQEEQLKIAQKSRSKEEAPTEEEKDEVKEVKSQEETSVVEESPKEGSGLEEGEVDGSSNEGNKESKDQETSNEPQFVIEPTEEEKAVADEPKPVQKKTRAPLITKKRKISIPSAGSTPVTPPTDAPKKRRWGSSSKSSKPISTESLKDLIPGVQVHSTPALEAVMDFGKEDQDDADDREAGEVVDDDEQDKENKDKEVEETERMEPEAKKRKDRIVKLEEGRRKIKIKNHTTEHDEVKGEVKMEVESARPSLSKAEARLPIIPILTQSPVPAERSPSPARNPESVNVHLKNLVRPFTLNQLKELLGKHGTLVDDGFWIDKIKSHCYAVYSDIDGARATRAALHGVKWPPTSPKILSAEFEDDHQMARDTDGALGKKSKEEDAPVKRKHETEKPRDVEEEKVTDDDNSPADLLDNLFRKTKTTPCLYWLPLTAEQIVKRDQEREEKRKKREEARKRDDEEREKRRGEREKEREREREREKEREQARNRARDRSRSRENRGKVRSRSPVRRRRSSGSRSRSRSRSWSKRK